MDNESNNKYCVAEILTLAKMLLLDQNLAGTLIIIINELEFGRLWIQDQKIIVLAMQTFIFKLV